MKLRTEVFEIRPNLEKIHHVILFRFLAFVEKFQAHCHYFAEHTGFGFCLESAATTAAEAPDQTAQSRRSSDPVYVALLRRRRAVMLSGDVGASPSWPSTVGSRLLCHLHTLQVPRLLQFLRQPFLHHQTTQTRSQPPPSCGPRRRIGPRSSCLVSRRHRFQCLNFAEGGCYSHAEKCFVWRPSSSG